MATMLLAAAGSAIGSAFGGAFLGFSAATIGGAIGSFAGSVIDSLIIGSLAPDQRIEGAKLDDLRLTSATEGAVIPRLYGTMRLGGNIIWATDFREEQFRQTQGGGKGGGPKVVTEGYRYYASFAVALCEGPIGGVCRIWADGKPFDVPGAVIRVHLGSEAQMPDPFIEAKEGLGQAPAYRGVAYVVFEDLALETFGNRLPQLSFEVIRPSPDPAAMERLVRAVNLIPSAGEFVYATETVTRTTAAPGLWGSSGGNGASTPENENSVEGLPDLVASLNRLDAALPECDAVSLVVSWFGTDLRAGACQIKPGVESTTKTTTPMVWRVNGVTRTSAHVVSTVDGGPAYGGTPTDAAVVQAIQELKARGKRVTFYPFILMDIPEANTLPNPYSPNGSTPGQPVYPWRGRITCAPAAGFAGTVDKTAAAASQVANFFGAAAPGQFAVSGTTVSFTGSGSDWGLRRMILHYAHLCAAAGGVDAFLIGTEMRGLTQIRSGASTYPAVTAFVQLAADVSAILGPGTKVSYAADWSEYFGHQPADGSGDVFFHLDPLWASPHVDFVAIDNYLPLSDWRDGDDHLDALAGWQGPKQAAYLQANIEGGEGYDWFYSSSADRLAQIRTPITDGAGKPWVFRPKDLRNWWGQPHINRPGGIESGGPTAWVPGSKPIRFTEAGAPCVDRGTNQPNVFVDPKSSESLLPHFSRGWPDEFIQRRYAEALIGYWANPANNLAASLYSGRMIETAEIALWTWDARPFPAFPARSDVWSDAENWRLGHWLTGRAGATGLAELVAELCARAGLAASDLDVTDLAGSVPGFAVNAIESPRASIETLARLFGFDAFEAEGKIRFRMRGQRPVATITLDTLVAASREAEDLELTRAQETELPLALKWRLMARDEEFAGITVEARRITVDTARISAEQLPIASTSGAAERGVRRALFEAWVGREKASFTLPPSLLALDPADVILLDHDNRLIEFALTSITDGAGRRVEARRSDRALYDLAPGSDRGTTSGAKAVYGPPLVALMNLPQLSEDFPDWQPYAAAHAAPWYGTAAVWRSASTDGFAVLTTISRPGWFGTLAFPFYAGPTNRFDRGNELWVDMIAGQFASVSDTAVFSGTNWLAIETAPDLWEIVGFATASLQSPGRWRLTRLLRGLLGTEDAIANPATAGARVVVLDGGVKPLPIGSADYGAAWNWRIGASSKPAGDPANLAVTFAPSARGLRPWRPCLARRVNLPGGDIALSWTRRTRAFAGDNWALTEVPLGEAAEGYEIDILNGAAVVRTVSGLATPAFTYTTAMQTADFGAPVSGHLALRIAQTGALGRGAILDITLCSGGPMADTPNIRLTYLEANQAQKHITVNEAFRALDALVQPAVESTGLNTPPGSPVDGARYVVGAAPTGTWAGQAFAIAAWQDGAWALYPPAEGWSVWDRATDAALTFLGGVWVRQASLPFPDNLFRLADDADPTKLAAFDLSGLSAGTTRTFTLPNLSATLAHLGNAAQTFMGATTFSNAAVTIGTATTTATYGIGTGGTTTGVTKTVNLGTGGAAGSTTVINLGSTTAGALGSTIINTPTVTFAASVTAIGAAAANVTALGLGLGGASPDASNRLSVNAAATLLNNAGGSHEATINKAVAGNDASLALKTGFSARALFGLLGTDDVTLKVSPNGSAFFDAFVIDRATGRAEFPEPLILPGLAAIPVVPPAGKLALYGRQRAGAPWLEVVRPSGRDFPLQPHTGLNRIGSWAPVSGATIAAQGIALTSVGTVSHTALTAGSLLNSSRRWRVTSAAVVDSVCDQRSAVTACWRGNAAGLGGFTLVARISLTTLQATGMGFFGLLSSVAALAVTTTLAVLVEAIGLGFQRGTHTNWQLVRNDATGAPPLVDLGAGFPVATAGLITLTIWCPAAGTSIWLRAVNELTGAVFEQEVTTDLPQAATFVAPRLFLNNGATAAAVAFECTGLYLETDF